MIPPSIRWRLPLSYAAIALLAAISLGFVLLLTVRSYYARQEQAYLLENAQAIRSEVAAVLEQELPKAALQSQLAGFAFLSQTRIRLLDLNGEVIVDTGAGLEGASTTTFSVEVQVDQVRQEFSQTVVEGSPRVDYRSMIIVGDESAPATITTNRQITTSEGALPQSHELITHLPVIGTFYGFSLGSPAPLERQPSDQVVRLAVKQEFSSELWGYIELSEGPAYGQVVAASVARRLVAASLVAVLLSAGIGWVVSRRLTDPLLALTEVTRQMTAGDLTARADVKRGDEIGLLGRAFNRMVGQVEITINALRRFVSDAAHELHTPLTVLHSDLELIGSSLADPDQSKRVERAQQQVSRLESLTSRLLDLSRIESNAMENRHQPVKLNEFVLESCEHFASRADFEGISFTVESAPKELVVRGDRGQLSQALGNLLDNAIKFTPAGGSIRVSVRGGQNQALIEVFDTGIGVPQEDLPYLFDRFHRGRNASSFSGSGLGLAIVKAVAERAGGSISVANTSPGTRFTLCLPLG